jgi:hypothetical protein
MHTAVLDTNLWQPSWSLDLPVLFLIAFVAVIESVAAGIIVLKY